MKTLSDYIQQQLKQHLSISYNVYESAGLFDGIETLSKKIVNKIKKKFSYNKTFTIELWDDDIDINSKFFKQLLVKCDICNRLANEGQYIVQNNILDAYDEEEDKLNRVVIRLELSQRLNEAEIYQVLIHELTHAYDDYNGFKRGNNTTLKDAYVQSKYKNILDAVDSKEPITDKLVGQILYFISDIEKNAFCAQFAGYLYNHVKDENINNPHKAYEIIVSSDLYNNYLVIGDFIEAMHDRNYDLFSQENLHSVARKFNEIYNKDYTVDKIVNILYNRYKEAMNKINSNIGKICARYVKEVSIK